MAVTIDAEAGGIFLSIWWREQVASIDEAYIGLGLCSCNGRNGRLWWVVVTAQKAGESAGPAPAPTRVG